MAMNQYFALKKRHLRIILFLLPVLLYLNTLRNNYALDDSMVITQNIYVKQCIKGIGDIFRTETFTGFFKQKKELVQGGRYRPLSLASFAIEQEFFGEKPGLSHGINAVLYGLLCLVLFELLCQLLLQLDPECGSIPIAFLAVILFACHPLHTEVVANIKGRDELLAGLFFLLSLLYLLKSFSISSVPAALASGIFLFLALLSKENAIALIPVGIMLFLFRIKSRRVNSAYLGFIFLFIGAFMYLFIRYRVIGTLSGSESNELMNNPFIEAHHGEKLPTILFTWLLYLKLLIIPYPLTYDYYPYHIALQTWANPVVIFSLLLHLMILAVGIYYFHRNKLVAFAIFFYFLLLLPVSNLFINIGSFMNERFLFLPSVGFSLLAGYLIYSLVFNESVQPGVRKVGVALSSLALILFMLLTVNRNTNWKDNLTLFTHDVRISSESAKGNCAAGGILYETAMKNKSSAESKEMLSKAAFHLDKAISIYPNYVDALLLSGNVYFELNHDLSRVINLYGKIFNLAPDYELAYQNMEKILSATKDPIQRKNGYRMILQRRPNDFQANYQMGVTYGKMMLQLDSAIIFLSKAVQLQPDNKLANRDLGVAYAMSGKFNESLPYLEKLVKIVPDDADNYINLGITYQKLGRIVEANAMYAHAEALKQVH
jgi:protein O-mannosyl-transferase